METGWVTIVPSLLWYVFAVALIAILWKKIEFVMDAIAVRIQAGAPLVVGPVNIGSPPPGLRGAEIKSATAEGISGVGAPLNVEERMLERNYPEGLTDAIYLVHVTQVLKPYSGPLTGVWRVRTYIEAYEDENLLDEITRVTYRLHDTFAKKVISTESRDKSFEVWVNIYGEINLVAYVERRGKPPLWLTRYLDLPGRPTN